jgi:hypothetical protein
MISVQNVLHIDRDAGASKRQEGGRVINFTQEHLKGTACTVYKECSVTFLRIFQSEKIFGCVFFKEL